MSARLALLAGAVFASSTACPQSSPVVTPPTTPEPALGSEPPMVAPSPRAPRKRKRPVAVSRPATAPTPTPTHSSRPQPAPENEAAGIARVWRDLAECESSGRWHIVNPPYSGGLQFTASTWSSYAPSGYPASAHEATPLQQVVVAIRVLRGQGPNAWPVCSRRVGLTREAA